MSATRDIAASYLRPFDVLRRRLSGPPREDRALAYLMGGCLVVFIAQWPRLSREAHLDPSMPLDARLGGALMAWVFFVPLALYLVAFVTHVAGFAVTRRGTAYGARVALFWALLASGPLWLLHGLTAGFVGPGPALNAVGAVLAVGFLFLWGAGLAVVYGRPLEPGRGEA
ncbi:MAG: YIP1 family protein [Pseudomonadota bacterium]